MGSSGGITTGGGLPTYVGTVGVSITDTSSEGIAITESGGGAIVLTGPGVEVVGGFGVDASGGGGVSLSDTGGGVSIVESGGGGIVIQDQGTDPDSVTLPNLPTSDPHQVGQFWNNLGICTISSG